MKRHFFVLCILAYVLIGCYLIKPKIVPTSTNREIFAQINTQNTCFFKTPSNISNHTNVHFLLEKSYFVVVLSEQDNFYHVYYNGLNGYVNKVDITLVNEQIENPFLENITFEISSKTYLCSDPKSNENNQKLLLEKGTKLTYLGKIYGDEIAENSGNVWYYCKYSSKNGEMFGYVHSLFALNLSPITHKNEVCTNYVSKTTSSSINLLSLNLKTETILIVVVSLPILFALILFLKGYKKIY